MNASRLGIDIGGTSIKARWECDGVVVGEWRVPTPRGDLDGRATVAAVAGIAAAARADAVGVVCPGIVDAEGGVCVFSANLGWRDLPVRALLEERLGRPIGFGHDVHTAAVAEGIRAGAGERDVVAFLPLGTGVSAAFTRGGVPLPLGVFGGEVGQVLLPGGLRTEEVCSAGGLAARAGVPDGETVARRVGGGDPAATRIWAEAVAVLADMIGWICATIAPRIVILGGGLSRSGDLLLAPVRTAVDARLPDLLRPRLRISAHGADSALVGALEIAR